MTVSNNRRAPPAFQMYSSDRLASRDFKLMMLAERGLLHSCELECWTNGNVPADIGDLARTLGLEVAEVQAALTARVLARFVQVDDALVCPDLEAYRAQLEDHHRRKSEGGKKGMANRWGNREADNSVNSTLNNSLSREELSQEKVKSVAIEGSEHQEFIDAYEGPSPFEVGKNAGAPEKLKGNGKPLDERAAERGFTRDPGETDPHLAARIAASHGRKAATP